MVKLTHNLAATLVALRESKGLTQAQLAEALQVSSKQISFWETGKTVPSAKNLEHISAHYGITTRALVGGDPADVNDASLQVAQAILSLRRFLADGQCLLARLEKIDRSGSLSEMHPGFWRNVRTDRPEQEEEKEGTSDG